MSDALQPVPSSSSVLLSVYFDAPELSAPVLGKHPAPVVNRAQRPGVGAIQNPLAVAPHRDEADAPQHLQVLRHRGLHQFEGLGNLVDGALFGGDDFQNVASTRFSDGVEGIGSRRCARHAKYVYIPIWEYVKRAGKLFSNT